MKKKLLAMLMVGVLSISGFTGCGGSDSASNETTEQPAASEADSQEDTAEEAAEETEEVAEEETEEVEEAAAEEVEDESAGAEDYEEIFSNLGNYYVGESDDETTAMLMATDDDLTVGCLALYEYDSKESGSWMGNITVDEENGMMAIADEENGTEIGFSVEESEDGGYLLDMGDLGTATVYDTDLSTFAELMNEIDEGGEPQF